MSSAKRKKKHTLTTKLARRSTFVCEQRIQYNIYALDISQAHNYINVYRKCRIIFISMVLRKCMTIDTRILFTQQFDYIFVEFIEFTKERQKKNNQKKSRYMHGILPKYFIDYLYEFEMKRPCKFTGNLT